MGNQFELCCICGEFSDLTCPACKKLYCVHCFSFHGEDCYESTKKKSEQGEKRCSICGRYASIAPTVHCSDCQIEICRSCLWAHKKTHEAEKVYCVMCGDRLTEYFLCGTCNKPVCSGCDEKHQRIHKSYCAQCGKLHYNDILTRCLDCQKLICLTCGPGHKLNHISKPKYRCVACGKQCQTECDECKKPYCESCFKFHQAVHKPKQNRKCAECGMGFLSEYSGIECSDCHQWFHTGCYYGEHTLKEREKKRQNAYSTRQEYGRINLDDIKINLDPSRMEEIIKNMKESMSWARSEEAQQQARAEEERLKQEQKAKQEEAQRAREKADQEAFFKNFWNTHQQSFGSYDFGSWNYFEDEPEETDTYKSHYTGQQSQSNSYQRTQQQTASAPSHELTAAFSLLQLSTRATVQEVKRARNRLAKQGEYRHPDVGGTHAQFIKMTNAYELALAHAERNER